MAKNLYTNQRLVGVTPQAPGDLVSMEWVEQYVIGKVKSPVRVVSRTNLAGVYAAGVAPAPATRGTLTLGTEGVLIVDSVPLALGDRVLLTGQTDATQNGIYIVTVAGEPGVAAVLERADDWDTNDQIFTGVRINIKEGTLYARTTWSLVTTGTLIIDTTAFAFVQVGATTGAAKYSATITGDSSETDFTIQHDLGTRDIMVAAFNLVTNAEVGVGVTIVDVDNVNINFDTAPSASQTFRIIIVG